MSPVHFNSEYRTMKISSFSLSASNKTPAVENYDFESDSGTFEELAQPVSVQSDSVTQLFRAQTRPLLILIDKGPLVGFSHIPLPGTICHVVRPTARDTCLNASAHVINEQLMLSMSKVYLNHLAHLCFNLAHVLFLKLVVSLQGTFQVW